MSCSVSPGQIPPESHSAVEQGRQRLCLGIRFYDLGIEGLYREARKRVNDALRRIAATHRALVRIIIYAHLWRQASVSVHMERRHVGGSHHVHLGGSDPTPRRGSSTRDTRERRRRSERSGGRCIRQYCARERLRRRCAHGVPPVLLTLLRLRCKTPAKPAGKTRSTADVG
jgi:hypothetical protein